MTSPKLDVSTGAGGTVAVKRSRFDQHLSTCNDCTYGSFCPQAETLWRVVCFAALAARQGKRS